MSHFSYRICNCDDFTFINCQFIISRFSRKIIHNPSLLEVKRGSYKCKRNSKKKNQKPPILLTLWTTCHDHGCSYFGTKEDVGSKWFISSVCEEEQHQEWEPCSALGRGRFLVAAHTVLRDRPRRTQNKPISVRGKSTHGLSCRR